jgi:hypothetical protein
LSVTGNAFDQSIMGFKFETEHNNLQSPPQSTASSFPFLIPSKQVGVLSIYFK